MKQRKIFRNYSFLLAFTIGLIGLNVQDSWALEEVKFVRELTEGLQEPIDAAVNDSGDIYVLDRKQAKVSVFNPQGELKSSFGQRGSNIGEFNQPKAVALTLTGNVVVADTGNSRVQVFGPQGEFVFQLGHYGKDEGQFKSPDSIAIDNIGNIYIGDSTNKTISKFSPNGAFLDYRRLSFKPTDLVFDLNEHLYVLMPGIGRIIKFNLKTYEYEQITLKAEGKDLISSSAGISVDMRGDIYLIETDSHSVKKIDQNKKLLFSFGSQGDGKGQFNWPSGITADRTGHVYVADARNRRVQVLEITGSPKGNLEPAVYLPPLLDYDRSIDAGPSVVDLNYDEQKGLYALAEKRGEILIKDPAHLTFQPLNENLHQLKRPGSIEVDPRGRILVADTGNHRLQLLDQEGNPTYFFGKRGDQAGEFNALGGVAADSQGNIYVADSKNNRIQIFSEDGIYLKAFGEKSERMNEAGPSPGTFLSPKTVAFDSRDRLFVLDSRNRRIQIFTKGGEFIRQIGGLLDQEIQFEDPVDLSIDEHDYLYVADRGRHKVTIIDPNGELVMDFGSNGQGPSYFPSLSSVTVANGKIYVANYGLDQVGVFNFRAQKGVQENRIYLTKISKPLEMVSASDKIKYAMARKLTLEEAQKELAFELGVDAAELSSYMKIESEELMATGQIKLTVSIPKEIPFETLETKDILSRM
ncbi:MAG TPA: NHL repeat-containing protein [Candidatus Omnitrophota bacterium]|nr:NHL repeat-containing protein [Candidatus Omnitrophota bacterium]